MLSQLSKITGGCLLAFAFAAQVVAGSQNHDTPVLPVETVAALSKKIEKYSAEHGARVFLLARQGRPDSELPPDIRYTHVSFAVYSDIETDDGRRVPGYAVYNLYQLKDDPSKSRLVVDFPLDFLAGAHTPRAGIIIPSRDLQKRLMRVIHSDTYAKLHNPSYSAISNPYSAKYQNCTEHVLDVLNAAIYQTDDIEQLKTNTRAHFAAQPLKISPFKLFLGAMFKPDIKTSDHQGRIQTTTFESIAKYLQDNGLAESVSNIEL